MRRLPTVVFISVFTPAFTAKPPAQRPAAMCFSLSLLPQLARGVVACLLACLSVPLLAETSAPLRVAVSLTPLSAPFFVAESQGFFAEHNLDIELSPVNGGHRGMSAMLDGDADMATASDMVVMNAASDGQPFYVVGTLAVSAKDLQLIAHLDSGVLSASRLTGKKVGVTKGTESQYYLDTQMLFAGVGQGQVDYVQVEPEHMAEMLHSRRVDAVSTWQPWVDRTIEQLANKTVVLGDARIYTLTFNLVITPALEQQSDVVQRLLRALLQAEAFILNNPGQAQSLVAAKLGIAEQSVRRIWNNYDFRLHLDQSLIIALESQFEWKHSFSKDGLGMNAFGKESAPMFDFLTVINPGYLQSVAPKRVTLVR